MLCDAFCSHTALSRAKGVHQPRDSAVFFLKTNNHSDSKAAYTTPAEVKCGCALAPAVFVWYSAHRGCGFV